MKVTERLPKMLKRKKKKKNPKGTDIGERNSSAEEINAGVTNKGTWDWQNGSHKNETFSSCFEKPRTRGIASLFFCLFGFVEPVRDHIFRKRGKVRVKTAAKNRPLPGGSSTVELVCQCQSPGAPGTSVVYEVLDSSSSRFQQATKQFYVSLSRRDVLVIQVRCVINGELRDRFRRKRSDMQRLQGGGSVSQMTLFHGTSQDCVDSICREGFRLPTACHCHGFSICMAQRSSIAHWYAKCTRHNVDPLFYNSGLVTCRHFQLVCDVLTGDMADHIGGDGRAPCNRKTNRRYNSWYRKDHADQFGIFDSDQIYPAYIIEYTCVPTCPALPHRA